MSHILLAEKYAELVAEAVAASGEPACNYTVNIYADRNNTRTLLWKAGFNEKTRSVHQGIEIAMADLIMAAKTGIVSDTQEPWDDYEWVRDAVLRTTGSSAFSNRFNSSHLITRSVFHTGQRICYESKLDIIGKPVNLEIYVRVPSDPFSALPTYYLKFTVDGDGEEVRREGMSLTSAQRTCCFNYVGSLLRFNEEEIVMVFKEELIAALGLEGKSE